MIYFLKLMFFAALAGGGLKAVEHLLKRNKLDNSNRLLNYTIILIVTILTLVSVYYAGINGAAITHERYR